MIDKKQTPRDLIYPLIKNYLLPVKPEREPIPLTIYDYKNYNYNKEFKRWSGTAKITKTTIKYNEKSKNWIFSPPL